MIKKKVQNSKVINGIYNDGACIKIVSNGNIIQVIKSQIKTIDTVRNDMVRLDIGEGALKNIYIRLSEVVYPTGLSNVIDLRNYIKGLLIQNGFATEVKQEALLSELKLITALLNGIKTLLQNQSIKAVEPVIKEPVKQDIVEVPKEPVIPTVIGKQPIDEKENVSGVIEVDLQNQPIKDAIPMVKQPMKIGIVDVNVEAAKEVVDKLIV